VDHLGSLSFGRLVVWSFGRLVVWSFGRLVLGPTGLALILFLDLLFRTTVLRSCVVETYHAWVHRGRDIESSRIRQG